MCPPVLLRCGSQPPALRPYSRSECEGAVGRAGYPERDGVDQPAPARARECAIDATQRTEQAAPPVDLDRLAGERAVLARVQDHLLGGGLNFGVDRAAAAAVAAGWPDVARAARANRHFLRHAVGRALDLGVRQFLDLGSGFPSVGSTHEIAQGREPSARVAYVEREPTTVAHGETMLAGRPGVSLTRADVRDVDTVLAAPGVGGLLDLDEPVALLALATLHHLADADDPAGLVAAYRTRMAPGSLLAISHLADECPEDPDVVARRRRGAAHLATAFDLPFHARGRAGVAALGAPFGVAEADLADLGQWCPESPGAPLALLAVVSGPLTG